jgi:hypothetical protein
VHRREEYDQTNSRRSFHVTKNHIISKAPGRKKFLLLKIAQNQKCVLISSGPTRASLKLEENNLYIRSYGTPEGKGWNPFASRHTMGWNACEIGNNEETG